MKFGVFAISGLTLALALAAPAFAGTINGTEMAGAKYATSKCKTPAAPGLSIRTIKSKTAFGKAAASHNEFTAAIEDYQKCRVAEANEDQNVILSATKADIEALIAIGNAEAEELNAKNKELSK